MSRQHPNILFIVLDTQRRDRLSLYGYGRETSPHLDAFARDAAIFERGIAPAQWTIPSHVSMFTGLYPSVHQVTQGSDQISGMHPTLPEILHGAGYHTVGFCNNPLVGVLNNGLQRGFDQFYNYAGAAVQPPIQPSPGTGAAGSGKRWRKFARPTQNRFAHSDWLFRASMNPLLVPLWTRFINYKGNTPLRSMMWRLYSAAPGRGPAAAAVHVPEFDGHAPALSPAAGLPGSPRARYGTPQLPVHAPLQRRGYPMGQPDRAAAAGLGAARRWAISTMPRRSTRMISCDGCSTI